MSPFELVTLLLIPQLFSRAITHQTLSMTNAVIGSSTLFLLVFLTSAASYRSLASRVWCRRNQRFSCDAESCLRRS